MTEAVIFSSGLRSMGVDNGMDIGEKGLPEIEGCFSGIAVGFSGQIRLALRGVAGSRIAPLEALGFSSFYRNRAGWGQA